MRVTVGSLNERFDFLFVYPFPFPLLFFFLTSSSLSTAKIVWRMALCWSERICLYARVFMSVYDSTLYMCEYPLKDLFEATR